MTRTSRIRGGCHQAIRVIRDIRGHSPPDEARERKGETLMTNTRQPTAVTARPVLRPTATLHSAAIQIATPRDRIGKCQNALNFGTARASIHRQTPTPPNARHAKMQQFWRGCSNSREMRAKFTPSPVYHVSPPCSLLPAPCSLLPAFLPSLRPPVSSLISPTSPLAKPPRNPPRWWIRGLQPVPR